MLNIRLSDQIEQRLVNLSKVTGRTKSYYARQAIESFLDAEEDYLLAISRLERKNPRVSLDDLEDQLGLDD